MSSTPIVTTTLSRRRFIAGCSMAAGAMALTGCDQQTILLTWTPIMTFWEYFYIPTSDSTPVGALANQVQLLVGIRSLVNTSNQPFTLDLGKIVPVGGGTQDTYSGLRFADQIQKDFPGYLGFNGLATRLLEAKKSEAVYYDGGPAGAVHLLFNLPFVWSKTKTIPELTYKDNSKALNVGLIRANPSELPVQFGINLNYLQTHGTYALLNPATGI